MSPFTSDILILSIAKVKGFLMSENFWHRNLSTPPPGFAPSPTSFLKTPLAGEISIMVLRKTIFKMKCSDLLCLKSFQHLLRQKLLHQNFSSKVLTRFACLYVEVSQSLEWLMILILDGFSKLGGRVRSNICYLICVRHPFRSRVVTHRIFFSHFCQHILRYQPI